MEPLYDEGPKNWQNLFAITNISRFFFIYFTINNVGKENHSLYLKRLEVHFFSILFYHFDSVKLTNRISLHIV